MDLVDDVWASNERPGVISAAANVIPGFMSKMLDSDWPEVWDTSMEAKLKPFAEWMHEDLIS